MLIFLCLAAILLLPAILPFFLEKDQPGMNMSVDTVGEPKAPSTDDDSVHIVNHLKLMEKQYEMV